MRLQHTICILATLAAVAASAQSDHSIVLDTVGTSGYPDQYSVLCSDGSSILCSSHQDGVLLRRTDAVGDLAWNKWYAGARTTQDHYVSSPLAADGNGGFFIAHAPYGSTFDENSMDPDTAIGRVVITHIASDGSVVWRTDLERTAIGGSSAIGKAFPTAVSLVVHDQDLMYALVEHFYFPPELAEWHLVAMDPSDGTVLWVRDVENNDVILTTQYTLKTVCMSNGDVIVGCNDNAPLGKFFLARISTNGDLIWMNRYGYTNGAIYSRPSDFTVSPTGKIIAMGRLTAAMNGFVLYYINGDGTVDHGEFVEDAVTFGGGQVAVGPSGGLIVDLANAYQSTVLLFGDTLGGNMERHELRAPIVGPNTLLTCLDALNVNGQRMLVSGALHVSDNQFGTWSRRPVIAGFDPLAFAHCLDSVSVSPRLQIPSGVVVAEPCVDGTTTPSTFPYIQVTSPAVALVDVPSPATIDLCDMVISTGEMLRPDAALRVWPVPASTGTVLDVSGAERCTIELLDPQGRVVRVQAPSPTTAVSITTGALAPGSYVVRCISPDGLVRVAWVMLD